MYQPGLICLKCPIVCKTCTSELLCTSCTLPNTFIYVIDVSNHAGNCICQPGYFIFNGLCQICDGTCY